MEIIDCLPYFGDREIFNQGELAARIVTACNNNDLVVLFNEDYRSTLAIGVHKFLISTCNAARISTDKLLLIFHDFDSLLSSTFKTIALPWEHNITLIHTDTTLHVSCNYKYAAGVFAGRANSIRMYAIYKKLTSRHKDAFISSLHQGFNDVHDKIEQLHFMQISRLKHNQCTLVAQHSDIDNIRPVPIMPGTNNNVSIWSNVYSMMPIEIACETSAQPGCYHVSEKIFRPIAAKRIVIPVMPAGWKQFVTSTYGFSFFEDELGLPTNYSNLPMHKQVDAAFNAVETLHRENKIVGILDRCWDKIEHNYAALQTLKQHEFANRDMSIDDAVHKLLLQHSYHLPPSASAD